MAEVFGPGHLFFPRALEGSIDWLPKEPFQLDSLTGAPLPVAGDLPVVCSAGFDTPAGAELLELAGVTAAPNRIQFDAGQELKALARALAVPGQKAVFSHAPPKEAAGLERSWIDLNVLEEVNNKANLAALTPAEHVPPRKVVNRSDYLAEGRPGLPIVLKAATEQSSGGGYAVAICRTADGLEKAERLFAGCDRIVVEQYLDIVRNPCLSFAVMPDGSARYLGFADQDVTPDGKYRGNWLELDSMLDEVHIEAASEPVRRAAARGYRGFAGVDIALTRDGRTYVLDLNFRVNGCTAPLLLEPAVRERTAAPVIHFRRFVASAGAEKLAQLLRPYVACGRIIPLNLFDPAAAGYSSKPGITQALILGESRDDILVFESEVDDAIS
jgi:hypothetical protein